MNICIHEQIYGKLRKNHLDSTPHSFYCIKKSVSFILNLYLHNCEKHILNSSLHCVYNIMIYFCDWVSLNIHLFIHSFTDNEMNYIGNGTRLNGIVTKSLANGLVGTGFTAQ